VSHRDSLTAISKVTVPTPRTTRNLCLYPVNWMLPNLLNETPFIKAYPTVLKIHLPIPRHNGMQFCFTRLQRCVSRSTICGGDAAKRREIVNAITTTLQTLAVLNLLTEVDNRQGARDDNIVQTSLKAPATTITPVRTAT